MAKTNLPEVISRRPQAIFPRLWPNFFSHPLFDMLEQEVEPLREEMMTTSGARIYEEDGKLHVEAPMPGLKSDEIEVSLNKGVLWIKGSAKEEERDKKRKFYRSSSRNYSYSFFLPTQIDEKQEPEAVYADGILNIMLKLPKTSEAKKISVKNGRSKKA